MRIEKNKVVEIEYTLRDDTGEELETSEGEPLLYLHGAEEMFPKLEAELEGKQAGDKVTVTLAPEDAYGDYDEEATDTVPRSAFPEDAEIEEGDEIDVVGDDDEEHVAWVVGFTDEEVELDFNHPYAGETLTFELEIKSVRDASEEEIEHGHAHDPHHMHDHDDEAGEAGEGDKA